MRKKSGIFSYKPRPDLGERLDRLVAATERTKAYFLHKMMEIALPEMEARNAHDLAVYDGVAPAIHDSSSHPSPPLVPLRARRFSSKTETGHQLAEDASLDILEKKERKTADRKGRRP